MLNGFWFVQEGLTKVEHRTADIIQETKKNMRRKNGRETQVQVNTSSTVSNQAHVKADYETQLKASRNVRNQNFCLMH